MKNFPLKFLVIVYSLLFLVPLFFILWLSNSSIFIAVKVLLGIWLILTFFQASQRYPHITLGPFLCFIGLFFVFWWLFQSSPFSYLFSLLFIIWFFGKFRQIDKIHEEAEQSIKQTNKYYVNFFNKKPSPPKLTENELRLKAAGVNFAIFTISSEITKTLQKEVKELKKLKQKEINQIFFVVSYVALFQAQKFFWENFIQDEGNARIFEGHLFRMFEKTSGVNPKPHIQDLVEYVQQGEPSREIQYIGSKICRLLEKESAFLMLEISTVFTSFLKHGFFESIKRAWELPNETLKEMADKLEDSD